MVAASTMSNGRCSPSVALLLARGASAAARRRAARLAQARRRQLGHTSKRQRCALRHLRTTQIRCGDAHSSRNDMNVVPDVFRMFQCTVTTTLL